ncbi:MAG: sulfatase-like hydrolase/transferase [Proteobacteria bacterium]|nr:sulfatase-like hydrolase/transferase [Pseudomonadota bacterium]
MLSILWLVILIAPAATTLSSWNDWDVEPHLLFGASCWLMLGMRLLLPDRVFYVLSYPIALLGLVCIGADQLRQVDLLELMAQWPAYTATEVTSAMRPYAVLIAVLAATLAILALQCIRASRPSSAYRWRLAVWLAGTAAMVSATPASVWVRAWPADLAAALASGSIHSRALRARLFPMAAGFEPRAPGASWNASRRAAPAARETFVLIIGESVRADFLRECGGPRKVRPLAPGSLVACDVTAGSDATHTSVPLLVSREMPGHDVRISSDATFLAAFAQVGFRTHWYGMQDRFLAWPDAQQQAYTDAGLLNAPALLPLFTAALAEPTERQAIVLHAYDAHAPYCNRFDAARAPYAVACDRLGALPTNSTIKAWRAAYADAVDASVDFIDQVIDRLSELPGEVFLVYTPDHAENLLDDKRQLYGHALRHPTRWDIQVPAVFWANDAWRSSHSAGWAALRASVDAPLMHADVVPTLLGAASVAYQEPRREAANLLANVPSNRVRKVQRSLGSTTTWAALMDEAR